MKLSNDDGNKNKPELMKVRIGKRYEIRVVEISEENGKSIYRAIPVKFWFFTIFTMSISLLALVLQIISMSD